MYQPLSLLLLLAIAALSANAATLKRHLSEDLESLDFLESTESEERHAISLPYEQEHELFESLRKNPEWFAHLQIDNEHMIAVRHRLAKPGTSGMALLQLYLADEANSMKKNAAGETDWTSTEHHTLNWNGLSEENLALVEALSAKAVLLTAETTKPHACPKGSYVADATPVEVDRVTTRLEATCNKCAPDCDECHGPSMDQCDRCAFEDGEENFLLRLDDDPDVCVPLSLCLKANRKPEYDDHTCVVHLHSNKPQWSDDKLWKLAKQEKVKTALQTAGMANAIAASAGQRGSNKDAKATLEEEQNVVRDLYKRSQAAEADAAKLRAEAEKADAEHRREMERRMEPNSFLEESTQSTAEEFESLAQQLDALEEGLDEEDRISLGEISSTEEMEDMRRSLSEVKDAAKTATAENAGISVPGLDEMCKTYKEKWSSSTAQNAVSLSIFGYKESTDSKLKSKVAGKTTIAAKFAAAKRHKHSQTSVVKRIAAKLDKKASGKQGDSQWCQTMVVITGLEKKVNSKSTLAKFLTYAGKILKIIGKFANINKLVKHIIKIVRSIFNWVNKQRKNWDRRIKKLKRSSVYRTGLTGLCTFSKSFRVKLNQAQTMCHINDDMNAKIEDCKELSDSLKPSFLQTMEPVSSFMEVKNDQALTGIDINAKLKSVEKVFNTLQGLFNTASRLKSKLAPIIKFLETRITLFKGGALCTPSIKIPIPYAGYGRRRRWSGFYGGVRWKRVPKICIIPQIGPFTPGQILSKLGSLISKAMKFVMKPFNPLLNPVKKMVDSMKKKIMGKLTRMFNRAFNLDKLMVIPTIKNKVTNVFTSTKNKIKKELTGKVDAAIGKLPAFNKISAAANSNCFSRRRRRRRGTKSTKKSTNSSRRRRFNFNRRRRRKWRL
jgi:hypothetical protein